MSEVVADALQALRCAVDGLLEVPLSALADADVPALVRGVERESRRLGAVDHRLLAELADRALAGRFGRASVADLLVTMLRVTPGEAKRRVTQAGDLGPRHSLQGEHLAPVLPAAAAAVAAGEMSAEHVAVIAKAIEAVPTTLGAGVHQIVESTLVEAARHQHPGQLGKTAALLLARLDPDGLEPQSEEHERRRDFCLAVQADGSSRPRGRLTPEVTAVWTTILDALSAPLGSASGATGPTATSSGPTVPSSASSSAAAGTGAAAPGDPSMDRRTAGQRRHDALAEAGRLLLRSGELRPAGGVPVTVLVRTTAADLATNTGVALTERGTIWPVRDLLAASSDAAFIPVQLSPSGAVLALGRTERLATRAQRLALHARDGGCTFPGCDRPASWTEVHHVIPWRDGGPTDIDNLTLVCRFHHREFERHGWQARITDGLPEWIPPPWLDPLAQPQRNTVHHPPELEFAIVPGAA